jgi:hypothetical protein
MSDARSSLEQVRDGLECLSLSGTKRSASDAGFDSYRTASPFNDSDDESVGGDGKGAESDQPPKDPAMDGKRPKLENPVEMIVKPHYGYRDIRNERVWYKFCTFQPAFFENGLWLSNHLRRESFEELRETVVGIRYRYNPSRHRNHVSAICDIFLSQYSNAEEMPWKTDLTQIGQPITLIYRPSDTLTCL